MGSIQTIAQLNSLNSTTLSGSDLFLVTDISDKETKNIATSEFVQHLVNKTNILTTGSFTGSFYGHLIGTADTASYSTQADTSLSSSHLIFNGINNGTASLSITSSNSSNSLSSSYAISSSFAVSASVAMLSQYSLTYDTVQALQSNQSTYSIKSANSNTSSFINYYGQDNGTVTTSSFSEKANRTSVGGNIINPDSTVVAYSISSSFAQQALTSSYVLTSSFSNFSTYAQSAVSRVISAVEFYISVVDSGSSEHVIINPTSWHNVSNITTDLPSFVKNKSDVTKYDTDQFSDNTSRNPYSISFYVKFKTHPYYSNPQTNIGLLNTTVSSTWHLTTTNLPRPDDNSVSFSSNGWALEPTWYVSAFPCGIDGYIIKISIFDVGWSSGDYYNYFMSSRWKNLLNGSSISAIVYGNTQDLLAFGPPDTIAQQRVSSSYIPRITNTLIPSNNVITNFPLANSSSYGVITDIASNTSSNFNLLLLQNPNDNTNKIASLPSGYTITETTCYNPFTSSNITNIGYDSVNNIYTLLMPQSASYISATTLESSNKPSWTVSPFTFSSSNYFVGATQLTGSAYILISSQSISFAPNNVYTGSLPIYTLPSIMSNSIPAITGSAIYGISASSTPVSITSTNLNAVTNISGTNGAVAVGTNGVVLYTNNSGQNWYRVDYLSSGSISPLISTVAYVKNLTSVAYDSFNKLIFACGSDNNTRSAILYTAIPNAPYDTTASYWNWSSSYLKFAAPDIDTSSLNSIYVNNQNSTYSQFVAIGSCSVSASANIMYNLYIPNQKYIANPTPIIDGVNYNAIGMVNGNQYLLGGSASLNIYIPITR